MTFSATRGSQRSRFYLVLGALLSGLAGFGSYQTRIAQDIGEQPAMLGGVVFAVFGTAYVGVCGAFTGWLESHLVARNWRFWLRAGQALSWLLTVGFLLLMAFGFSVLTALGLVSEEQIFGPETYRLYFLCTIAWFLLAGYLASAMFLLFLPGFAAWVMNRAGGRSGVPLDDFAETGWRGFVRIMIGTEVGLVLAVLGLVEVVLGSINTVPSVIGLGLAVIGLLCAATAWIQHQ